MSKKPAGGNEAGAINPIAVATLNNTLTIDQAFLRGDCLLGLHFTEQTINLLNPEHRDMALLDLVNKEIVILEQNRSASANRLRMKNRIGTYRKWRNQMVDSFWKHGYWSAEAFTGFYDPSKGENKL